MKRIMTVMLAVIYITTGTIKLMAGEPENNDAQKKESVSDSVKVQTVRIQMRTGRKKVVGDI